MPSNFQDSLPPIPPQTPQFVPPIPPQQVPPVGQQPPQNPVVPPSSKKKMILILLIIAAIILIVAIIGAAFFIFKGNSTGKQNAGSESSSSQTQFSQTTSAASSAPQSSPSPYDNSYKPTADIGDSVIFDISVITQKTKDEIISMLGQPDDTGYDGTVVQYRKKGVSLVMSFDSKKRPFSIAISLPYDSHTKDKSKVVKVFNINENDPQYKVVFQYDTYGDPTYINGVTLER